MERKSTSREEGCYSYNIPWLRQPLFCSRLRVHWPFSAGSSSSGIFAAFRNTTTTTTTIALVSHHYTSIHILMITSVGAAIGNRSGICMSIVEELLSHRDTCLATEHLFVLYRSTLSSTEAAIHALPLAFIWRNASQQDEMYHVLLMATRMCLLGPLTSGLSQASSASVLFTAESALDVNSSPACFCCLHWALVFGSLKLSNRQVGSSHHQAGTISLGGVAIQFCTWLGFLHHHHRSTFFLPSYLCRRMLLSSNGLTNILLHCSLRSGNFLWLFCFLESQPEQVYFSHCSDWDGNCGIM